MKILLVSPRGFCAGVNMAIESLDLAIEAFGTPVYVYHEIVHNKYVVDSFRGKGAIFVEQLEDVPKGSHLLFSAHGVSPEIREVARQRKLIAIDATCPLVTKVHLEAIRFAKNGYTIILIGHEGHDEVIGTMGEAPEAILLVESVEDVDRLQVNDDARLAYLTQTTLSVDDANQIIGRLRIRFPQISGPPKEDICYATQNRQEAVRLLTSEADLVTWGTRLKTGEAARSAAGLTAVTMPPIAAVEAKLTAFETARAARDAAVDEKNKESDDVIALRDSVDSFLREDLWYEVQAAYRKDDPATARRKSRLWGVQYRFRSGEEPEPGEDAITSTGSPGETAPS